MNIERTVRRSLCIGIAAASLPAIAVAADEPAVLGEVIVTAQKIAQSAKDVPISIAVFGTEFFEKTRTTSFEELSRATPDLMISSAVGNAYTNVSIRGIGSDALNPGLEPSVGVFIDGVYQSRPASLAFDLTDIERLEILRGPQGTLYGKNTDAGAINLITQRPPDSFAITARAFAGDYGTRMLNASVGGPISDQVRVKLSGYTDQQDGYIHNTVPGIGKPDVTRYGLRAKLDWDVSSVLKIRTNLDYDSHRDSLINYAPLVVGADLAGAASAFGVTIPTDIYARRSAANFPNSDRLTQFRASVLVDYDLGDGVTLTSITAYQRFSDDNVTDVDYTALDLLDGGEHTLQKQFTQEFRVSSNPKEALSYLAGVYYYRQTQSDIGFNTVRNDLSLLTGGAFPAGAQDYYATDSVTWSYAAFGQLTQRFGDAWSGSLGLRYDSQHNDQYRNQPAGVTIPPIGPLSLAKSEDNVSGSATLRYALSKDANAYASVSQGYKGGGYNGLSVNTPAELGFSAERARGYEIGIKGSALERRLDFELALFLTKLTDLQVSNFDGVNFVVGNAAAATTKGVELSLSTVPVAGLRLDFTMSYDDATYDQYPDAPCTPDQVAATAPGTACVQDLAGKPLANAPKTHYYVAAEYDRPLPWQAVSGVVRVDYAYLGSHDLETSLAGPAHQAAYGIVNARLGIREAHDRWSIALVGKNLGDTHYLRSAYDFPLFSGSFLGAPGAPRTYGIDLGARF